MLQDTSLHFLLILFLLQPVVGCIAVTDY